tara:strand:+ start:1414 stop:1887 length:474 start_codon:yes stop_codon:yes gene_type:complete
MYFVEHQGADLLNEAIALRVMNGSGADANQLLNLHEASIRRQIIMVKTEKDEPLASLSFAKISKFTLKLLTENPDHKLQPYEYSEGKILYILDGFFRKNNFRISISLLMPQLRKYRLIVYVKNGKLKVLYNNNGAIRLLKSFASQHKRLHSPDLAAV